MSPFAIKMFAVLGLLCVLVQVRGTRQIVMKTQSSSREILVGTPQENEIVFISTRQILGHPFIKRKAEISYPSEFYLYSYKPSDIIHGIEIYELPDEQSCKLKVQIIGGLGDSNSTIKLKSGRMCGLYVRVTFRVHRAPPKGNTTEIPDQEEATKIPDQLITGKQVDEVNDDE